MLSDTVHFFFCCIYLSAEKKYAGQSVTQQGEVAPIWGLILGDVREGFFFSLNQLHRLNSNPCQFSHTLHLHYPITLQPAPLEKNIIFFSHRIQMQQREKLQDGSEIYYCSPWQQPEKQDIYKMNYFMVYLFPPAWEL